jgi:nucleoside 2-deoxyribosyltransferase
MKTIYLSGPITGCTYGDCTNWRQYVASKFASDIVGVSPLRGKEYLKTLESMPHTHDHVMSSSRGIMTRDRFDTMECDAIFVNLLETERVSIGTVMEVAWADMLRKPVILVMEKEGNLHDHPMVREAAGYRVETLEEGIALTNALLSIEFARNHQ